ncbi:hypothetical protein PF005_g20420 [Phytophthora fragariae]|uniref:RxLR effector protein n=1 Tax=Phytophthora fragariae TaxID=53985 RepID=A0A6A3DVC7_9STRA|nr:hypothetical protein PF003_g26059 [Phytophthora fragariae]KAE8922410.1 hypothetical protein PF009_g27330 [Phytophthora fragariae]KAE8975824.1 hypothetical protein PF011_g24313 [Phytophthora fragariae]KAE9073157.1 hypothetical protein PF010_g25191 [Phytophthora fragariae]KAE9087161.1 hypothetical protein PF007_g20481 [Phytophthora fragariae]
MRLHVILALIVVTFVANSAMGFASAEDTTDSNNSKRVALNKIVKRLRASREVGGEERGEGAQVAMMVGAAQAANRPSNRVDWTQYTQSIVHSVEDDRPVPKAFVALLVVLGLVVAAGAVTLSVKAAQRNS